MVNHPGDLFDYEDGKPDARPMDRDIPLFITVPTTAGTGSEVGRSTVVSDDETKVKKIIFSPRLLAQRVLLDPDLTLALPAGVTAATGMDALTHLVETYLAKDFHPICDGIALEGLRLVARNLTPCVDFARQIEGGARELLSDVDHRHARGMMLNAAMMGGVAFQKGLGVTHSLAHALSTVCDLHHGLANGICIPYAMAFNADAVPERMAELAQVVGANPWNGAGFVTWLTQLKEAIGIPRDAGRRRRAHGSDPAPGGDRRRRRLPPEQPQAGHRRGLPGPVRRGHHRIDPRRAVTWASWCAWGESCPRWWRTSGSARPR